MNDRNVSVMNIEEDGGSNFFFFNSQYDLYMVTDKTVSYSSSMTSKGGRLSDRPKPISCPEPNVSEAP